MGRPYTTELRLLPDTYAWALTTELATLKRAVETLRCRPLIVVGSGGSLGACAFAARLQEQNARLPARAMTPLEFVQHPVPQDAGVLLLSAGGGNPDILAAARHAVSNEYAFVLGLCTRPATRLKSFLNCCPAAMGFELVGPSKKDGFLATNSLILTCTALARAFGLEMPPSLPALELARAAHGDQRTLKIQLSEILESSLDCRNFDKSIDRRHVTILSHGWGVAPALDLESKWAECGFGSVVLTDPRNFAHGRHVGFVRQSAETLVIGLELGDCSGGPASALTRTLSRFPPGSAIAILRSPLTHAAGSIDLSVRVLLLTGLIGQRRGVDPGRPSVPVFGRALYNSGIPRAARSKKAHVEDLWIRRKVTPLVWDQAAEHVRRSWREQCNLWRTAAEARPLGGVVLDYDGTLCETPHCPPSEEVGQALARLLRAGLLLGIATGRGDSVLSALRSIIRRRDWHAVTVGMYNGAVRIPLAANMPSDSCSYLPIAAAAELLEASPALARVARVVRRPQQVSLRPRTALPDGLLRRFVLEALQGSGTLLAVSVTASGHSVDVVPSSTSKLSVVEEISSRLRGKASDTDLAILSVGDQGQAGGNDFTLLARPLGLTVDRTSSSFFSCWNVAAPGLKGTMALLSYLNAIQPSPSGRLHWSALRASRPPHRTLRRKAQSRPSGRPRASQIKSER